jgi:multiple sugar transport system permease protein
VGLPAVSWLLDPSWAKPALIIMSLWHVGQSMIIFLAGLQGIPDALYEAADMDGASWWGRFRHVTVPMLTPVIFFNMVMGIIGTFQVFTTAFIMTGGGPQNSTLFYVMYLYNQAFKFLHMGYASAMAWVLFIIIMIFTFAQLKAANIWVYYEGGAKG